MVKLIEIKMDFRWRQGFGTEGPSNRNKKALTLKAERDVDRLSFEHLWSRNISVDPRHWDWFSTVGERPQIRLRDPRRSPKHLTHDVTHWDGEYFAVEKAIWEREEEMDSIGGLSRRRHWNPRVREWLSWMGGKSWSGQGEWRWTAEINQRETG